jgi:exopolysaccharide biosynthesis polyprenyl glycosylphosphotransferase
MLSITNKLRTIQTVLLPVVDGISLYIGCIFLYLARYHWSDKLFGDVTFAERRIAASSYLLISLVPIAGILLIYAFLGMYEMGRKTSRLSRIGRYILGITVVVLAIITFLFFNEYNLSLFPNGQPFSRFLLAAALPVLIFAQFTGRLIYKFITQKVFKYTAANYSAVIIGNNDFEKILQKNPLVENILKFDKVELDTNSVLEPMFIAKEISEVYLFSDGQNTKLESEIAWLCERYDVGFSFAPQGFADFDAFTVQTKIIGTNIFLELKHSNLDGWNIIYKRVFDIIFASLFIVIFFPIYLLCYILVKLDSNGPAFYLADRVATDGRPFKVWKFRRLKIEDCTTEDDKESLKKEAALIASNDMRKDGVLYKIKDDPRMTKMGKVLEKTSLDEIPQFFNVLIGNMSVVGPRPHQPREVAKYQKHHFKVLNIKPGITGMAQTNGRSDLKFDDEVKYDHYYVEHWSFGLDLVIIYKTVKTIFGSLLGKINHKN